MECKLEQLRNSYRPSPSKMEGNGVSNAIIAMAWHKIRGQVNNHYNTIGRIIVEEILDAIDWQNRQRNDQTT